MAKYGEIEYRYDASGIRQEKQIGNVLHKYYTDGSRIYKEERGNEVLWYHYDNTGVTGLEHNGKKYYFQKNIHPDGFPTRHRYTTLSMNMPRRIFGLCRLTPRYAVLSMRTTPE